VTQAIDLDSERKRRKAEEEIDGLLRNPKSGNVLKTIANIEKIFSFHDAWRGMLVKDEFAERILSVQDEADGRVTPDIELGLWTDVSTTRARIWLSKYFGLEVDVGTIDTVIDSIAYRNRRHPVRDYLNGLRWDATPRLPTMLNRYFGAEESAYHSAIATMWMISGVARVFQPGCQADYMLVLIGKQGIRKSSAIRVLAKQWPADTLITIGDKDALQALHGIWIYEIAELSSIKSARDIERYKAFSTSRVDHYRQPYGRRFLDVPRQCIFAGTTNDDEPLTDAENRRAWVVDCGDIDLEGLQADVDQLWAEAYARYESKEPWYPTSAEINDACREAQEQHTRIDAWQPIVEKWLRKSRNSFETSPGNWSRFEDGVTAADALTGAIGMPKERIDHYAASRMGRVLRDSGLELKRESGKGRARKYFKNDGWDEAEPTDDRLGSKWSLFE